MLIWIDKSIAERAQKEDAFALQVIQSLATAQSSGFHILWAEKGVLKVLAKIENLSNNDRLIFYSILKKYATSASAYKKINFYMLVTFREKTRREINCITINPEEVPTFNYVSKVNVLAENLDDATLFEYIGKYYLRKNNMIGNVSICCTKDMGGGDTTAKKYKEYSIQKEMYCLAILDGDKKYKNGKFGDTYKKVKKEDKGNPFNCFCYGTVRVMEVENLLPYFLFWDEDNYKNSDIITKGVLFDMSYFDLKEGLSFRRLWDDAERHYWQEVFRKNADLICQLELAQELKEMSKSSKEYKDLVDKEIVIGGFGSKLFSYVLKNKKTELENIEDTSLLTRQQQEEWEEIGKLVVSRCCCVKVDKVTL